MEPRLTSSQLRDRTTVEERLKAIAAQLIGAHRRHDSAVVIPYARQAGLAVEGQNPRTLFMKTIQVFHPDRIASLWDRIQKALQESDQSSLEALARLLELRSERKLASVEWEGEEEEYAFGEEDFGFDEDSDFEDPWPDEEEEDDLESGTFYSAIKRELFGNLDLYPDAADLAKLEGELDLSDYDLHDLEGIEYCVGLTVLNLSQNNIDNVFPLRDLIKLEVLDLAENDLEDADALVTLTTLRELDLSSNDIDDVAFLDKLTRLRYVDLSGNPVRNRAILAKLEARGVIVIT